MDHKNQIKDNKYKNWVKAGLALKYFKDGISNFADEVASQEHFQIIQSLGLTNGTACSSCDLRQLKPKHSAFSQHGRCLYGRQKCNCLRRNTQSCPKNICDAIYDIILSSHVTNTPYWKNTDVTKWTTHPWEIVKCFINAPGYETMNSATETDISGLLHLFVNSLRFQGQMFCAVNLFNTMRTWRNSVFHSPSMEIDDQQLSDGIQVMLTILEDGKKLKTKECSKTAVIKLKDLQKENFIITTEAEAEVCRYALASITQATKELENIQHVQEEIKRDIASKKDQALQEIKSMQEEATTNIDSRLKQALDNVQGAANTIHSKLWDEVSKLRTRVEENESEIRSLNERLANVESEVVKLNTAKDKITEQLTTLEKRSANNATLQIDEKGTLMTILEQVGEQTVEDVLTVKILQSYDPISYNNRGKKYMKKFIVCDGQTYTRAVCFCIDKFPLLSVGQNIKMKDVIKKPDSTLVLTYRTTVLPAAPQAVNVSQHMQETVLKSISSVVSVRDASLSPAKTVLTIQGTVSAVSSQTVKRLLNNAEEKPFKRLKVKDTTGEIEVGLWNEMAERPIQKGDHITCKDFYTTTNQKIPIIANQLKGSSLMTKASASIIDSDSDSDLSIFDEVEKKVGEIVGIEYATQYRCCLNDHCKKKKLADTLKCSKCSIQYSETSCGGAYVAKVLIKSDKMETYTFFTECMESLLDSMNINKPNDVKKTLCQNLPIPVCFECAADKLQSLRKINYDP